MSPLFAEVHRWAALPFVWGEYDCILSLADWVQRVHGVDLGADLRMTYGSAGECQRVTKYFTDPVGFMDRAIAPLGLQRTDEMQPGDIAICAIPHARTPVGGLCVAPSMWAFKAPEGTTTVHSKLVKILAAWSVGYAE